MMEKKKKMEKERNVLLSIPSYPKRERDRFPRLYYLSSPLLFSLFSISTITGARLKEGLKHGKRGERREGTVSLSSFPLEKDSSEYFKSHFPSVQKSVRREREGEK